MPSNASYYTLIENPHDHDDGDRDLRAQVPPGWLILREGGVDLAAIAPAQAGRARRLLALAERAALVDAVRAAWDDEQAATLPALQRKAEANGYPHARVIDAAEVRELEPHLGPGVTGGMVVPDEHIIDPWTTPLAFAHDALAARRCCVA